MTERCGKPINAQTGDGSDYYTVCCRVLGHPHSCMSKAVDDRKIAAAKAKRAPRRPN